MKIKIITVVLFGFSMIVGAENTIDTVVDKGVERNNQAISGQQKIDAIAKDTDKLLSQYKSVLKINEDLRVYNNQLEKQIIQQSVEKKEIRDSLEKSGLIERQIVPTMFKMISSLESFVPIDMPFDHAFRIDRIKELRTLMDRGDVEINEKFRKVAEVYMSEIEYGRTVSTYRDKVQYDGKELEVNVLRVGRISLAFQTDDKGLTASWNKKTGKWEEVSAFTYKNAIHDAMKVARKQKSPEFIVVPVQKINDKVGG
ncbi:MAG: DUF3450 domain-containing protein [Methylacidiphilales bacterium]|nr:DUF3450 domain-containing protein [Candidatus Methylacidiphilales bacterium]